MDFALFGFLIIFRDSSFIIIIDRRRHHHHLYLLFVRRRVSATLSCPMKLHYYPLDVQSCPMMFESCEYPCLELFSHELKTSRVKCINTHRFQKKFKKFLGMATAPFRDP